MKWKSFMTPLLALLACFLLASASWARVTQFRAGVSSTVVQKGDKVYVSVELLNSDGEIDPFGYQEVDGLKVEVASLIGSVTSSSYTVGAADKGVVLIPVTENTQGTDLIQVTVKEQIYNDQGNPIWNTIGTKQLQVEVQQKENTAKSISLESVALPNTPVEDEASSGDYDSSGKCTNVTGGCTVEAGNPFILNLKACSDDPLSGGSCNLVTNQNSQVTVWLVGDLTSVEGNYAYPTKYEFNGTFQNGVAQISIPEGTVTKAGEYKVYISSTSTKKNSLTGEYEATELDNYIIKISPRQASKVKVSVYSESDQDGKAWCWANNTSSSSSLLMAKLVDEYGNLADNQTGLSTSSYPETVKIMYGSTPFATFDLGKQGTVYATDYLDCGSVSSLAQNLSSFQRGSESFSVELTKNDLNLDLDTTSIDVNVYETYLDLNSTNFKASNFAGTGSGVFNNATIANVISSAGNTTSSSLNGTQILDALVNKIGSTDGKVPFKFEFWAGTTLLNSVTVQLGNATNGTIAANEMFLDDISKNMTKVCAYYSNSASDYYIPKACVSVSDLDLRSKAKARDIKVYQLKSTRYASGISGIDFKEVSDNIINLTAASKAVLHFKQFNSTDANSANMYTIKTTALNNATVNATSLYPLYTARLVDNNGNFVDSSDLSITCEEGTVSGDDNITITWSDTTVSQDTCTIKGSSYSKTITVNLTWGAGPDHVQIDSPFEYVLTTSKIPITVTLRDADNNVYTTDPGNYTILISDSSLAKFYNSTTFTSAYELVHGDNKIDWNNGKFTLFMNTFAGTGDVTVTIQNAAGTVTGTKTFHIVKSTSDIPVTVGSVSASPASVDIAQSATSTITVTVKDPNGNAISSVSVSAESDNPTIASVSPASCTTDAQGECTFTVTGGSVAGTAHITFTSQSQSSSVDVTVTEEQATCDADHLDLCTTEEACTGAGGYWYDDACHSEQQVQPQPVPSEPTTEELTGDEIQNAPVQVGDVATGGDTMKLAVNFPAHTEPVDLYAAIALPDGSLLVLNPDNELGTDIVPFKSNTTDAVSATIFDSFPVCTPFGAAIPEGTYSVFTLVLPAGTDIASVDWANDPYELTYYSFDVSCE